MYCSLQESMIWYDTRVHTVHRLDKQHDDDSSEQMKNASPIESNLDMNQSKTDANCARRNPIVTSKVLYLSLLSLFWQISFFIFLYSLFWQISDWWDVVGHCGFLRGSYLEYTIICNEHEHKHEHEQRDCYAMPVVCLFVCFLEPSLLV